MNKKKGFSLIEVMAATSIMVMVALIIYGVTMQNNKLTINNSSIINETSAMESIADYMYSAPEKYYTENLNLKLATESTAKYKFIIESDTVSGIIEELNEINRETGNNLIIGNNKIKYIAAVNTQCIKENIYSCQITLYSSKGGELFNSLNRNQLEQSGFYTEETIGELKDDFIKTNRNIIINKNTAIPKENGNTPSKPIKGWVPAGNIPGIGWVPSGWTPNSQTPNDLSSPLKWNQSGLFWIDTIEWNTNYWYKKSGSTYETYGGYYQYDNNTGQVYYEIHFFKYILQGKTIPKIFNDWENTKWRDVGGGYYQSTVNGSIYYNNNNGNIYYSKNWTVIRKTIPHIFSWN